MTVITTNRDHSCGPERSELKPFSELDWKECTYYYVWVSMFEGNPSFKAILYTGFIEGGYIVIFSLDSFPLKKSSVFKIISKIGKI